MKSTAQRILIGTFVFFMALAAQAEGQGETKLNGHTLHYSTFNSSFLEPQVASAYKLTRSGDRGYLNVAVVADGASSGSPAKLSGTVTNILQQSQFLEFIEIREGDAVYYLAPFRIEHEEFLTFRINAEVAGSAVPEIKFQTKMYAD